MLRRIRLAKSHFSTAHKKLSSMEIIKMEQDYSAHNYHCIPVVFSHAKGIYVYDPEGKKYMDFLSGIGSVNQGHCHPKIIKALVDQAQKLTLSSRAFYNDQFGPYAKFITEYLGFEMILPMNTGAEAVETAIKLARKWGYKEKKIKMNEAIIVSCKGNYHGRTVLAISMSTDPTATTNYGPFVQSMNVEFNNVESLKSALEMHGEKIAAFIVEPIQGEAGIIVPEDGYLKACFELCKKHNVLFIADEVQTGLARTGKTLAFQYDNFQPDILLLGKSLSGGAYPVSAILSSKKVMLLIEAGTHGSTFGGNPLASAVAVAALKVLRDENLAENAFKMGNRFRNGLAALNSPLVKQIRGKGLLNAVEFDPSKFENTVWDICLLLKEYGLVTKPTQNTIIRFAPPLCISESEIDKSLEIIDRALRDVVRLDAKQIPLRDL